MITYPLIFRSSRTSRRWWLLGAAAAAALTGCGDDASPVLRADGAELVYRPAAGSAQNPACLPDGDGIVFTLFKHGYNEGPAILMLYDGEDARPLTGGEDAHDVNASGACTDRRYKRVVFSSDREGPREIWGIGLDGRGLKRITTHYGGRLFVEPTASPAGEWVVFAAVNGGVEEKGGRGSIWKAPTTGGEAILLADTYGTGENDRRPNWSPAADRIAFQRCFGLATDWDVCTFTAEGYDLKTLTDGAGDDVEPCWSPDGRYICFASNRDGEGYSLYVIPAAGGAAVRLTRGGERDGSPCWSPDGRWIIFESRENDRSALWRIAAPDLPSKR